MLRTSVFLVTASLALAQHGAHNLAPSEKPVTLLTGLGAWKHPIATRNAEAQKYFDQGLNLLYGFNRYEALRAFRKAAELDPQAAMAQWGIAASLAPYVNMDGDPTYQIKASCAAVEAGMKIEGVNAAERAWLDAAATRCPDFADPSKYIAAMKTLAARFPDDPDAQTLYAESLMIPVRWKWYVNGKPAEGMEEAERMLLEVLRRHPQHPGANHYYIHAVESSPTPERAVPSAQRLMGIVPGAGHMVHMPGHIWLVLGDFNAVVAVNERAAEVDRKYFEQTGVTSGGYAAYYAHNVDFLMYARQMQGRAADTEKVIEQLQGVFAPVRGVPEMAEIIETFESKILMTRFRIGRWDEVISAAQPKTLAALAMWHNLRAAALAAKGDRAAAQKEKAAFEDAAKKVDRHGLWSVNEMGPVMDLASAWLEARMEASPAKAVPLWLRAVELQDSLTYDEPPAWFYPIRESLGAAMLSSGDATGAEAVFREGLRRSPNNGRMLWGLCEALKAQNKSDAASWVQRELDKSWEGADIRLTLRGM
jgi:tetratricopeptide (TPR) repeat protein